MLRLNNITKIYSGTVALKNVTIEVPKGIVKGIIGKNGAGKTTLVGIMSGIISPTEGEILLNEKHFRALSRQKARKEGIAIVTQEAEIIPDWTVAENLFVPDFICSWNGQTIKWKKMYKKAEEIFNKHNLIIGIHEKAKNLTISEQQLLLILKACYIENAKIIILDEVSTALSKREEEILYKIIREQKKIGKAIIFISHRMDEILEICDNVTVIRDGMAIATESCNKLDEKKLSDFIVGQKTTGNGLDYNIKDNEDIKEEILSVNNLKKNGIFDNINFSLHKGEIIGFAGLRGSRRTEILKAIAGIEPADEGIISIKGKKSLRFKSPNRAISAGVVYLTEDRDKEGLVDILSVKDNLTMSTLKALSKFAILNKRKEKEISAHLVNLLSVQTPSYNEIVENLSGGNRQKVMLGRTIATKPSVYLLDEPTKGIDISAKREIMSFVRTDLSKNSGVILTSPDIPGLIEICDRIFVLYKGKIVSIFDKNEFNEASIYNATQGMVAIDENLNKNTNSHNQEV